MALPLSRGVERDFEPHDDLRSDADLDGIRDGMLAALEEEVAAQSEGGVVLGGGVRTKIVATGSAYRFDTAGFTSASDGDVGLVHGPNWRSSCVVTACRDGSIEVVLGVDIGPKVAPGARLLLDAPELLRRLQERIRESFDAGVRTPTAFNLRLALQTIGIGEISVACVGLDPEYKDDVRPLNEGQAHAVATAFRSPVTLVVAPGGTGKTVAVGAIAEACYRAGLRALVCAPANAAVDLQMMEVCERLQDEPGFRDGDVLRLGAGVGKDLAGAYGKDVILDELMARLAPEITGRIAKLQRSVDAVASELTLATANQADASPTVQVIRHRMALVKSALDDARREFRVIARSVTLKARVVGATLARAYLDAHIGQFDVVVIDETSQASPPAVFCVAGLARKHVVLVGDPYQLAAPVKSNGPNRPWLARSVFDRLDVVDAIRREEDVPYVVQLVEQRRCAEGICDMQREIWYGPGLRTASEVCRRERDRENVIFGTSSLCYIDTAPLRARAERIGGGTFRNVAHAGLIHDLVCYIASAGELPESAGRGDELLVVSHYRGQVAAIMSALGRAFVGRGVSVRTVHRAQGSEATTAIFDLTLAANLPVSTSGVLTAARPEQDGSRLLAVAASRGRSRFVFVGDMEWIGRSVAPFSVLGRMYAYLRENAYEIPIDEIRPGWKP